MKKIDKLLATLYSQSFNGPVKRKELKAYTQHPVYFIWNGDVLNKHPRYQGWVDVVDAIFKQYKNVFFMDYTLDAQEKYKKISNRFNIPTKDFYNFDFSVEVHYSGSTFEGFLNANKLIFNWECGMRHVITLNKNMCHVKKIPAKTKWEKDSVEFHQGINNQDDVFIEYLRQNFDYMPEDFKMGCDSSTMNYKDIYELVEMLEY